MGRVLVGMTESPGLSTPDSCTAPDSCSDSDGDEETLRPGPLWRHALWVVGVTVLGVGWGWAAASFRVGPDEYGLPLATPGKVQPYLVAWTATGLTAAAALRAVAARVPLYGPGTLSVLLTLAGTRLSLGWRPEPPMLGAMTAVALTAVAIWCAFTLRSGHRGQRVASDGPEAG